MKQATSFIALAVALLCLPLPGVLLADDTEIYGCTAIDVPPNVLIIFDTSGSMDTADVPGEYYDPAITYDGPYTSNAVYREQWRWWWKYYELFASDLSELNCQAIEDELLSQGYATGSIYGASGGYQCGGSEKKLLLGNYRNYHDSGIATKTRIAAAKEVITEVINTTERVRFGLMRFNDNQGGRIIAECGTDKATLINTVNGLSAAGWTPLAETLAEAGLYFAGRTSWYNSGTYTTPMQYRCQKNYIILMTDGEPTQDIDWRLENAPYINGDTIGDYDQDGHDPGSYASSGSDYLDDVAAYLYENDCHPTLGTGTSFEVQNITTYTIGFKTQQQLLQDTAINGGGRYYTADDISGLSEAFREILSAIAEVNATFVSPVVPVSRINRTYAGNYLYVGFFKPTQDGRWAGNLKKYGLGPNGQMLDADGLEATLPDGRIKDNARSYWSFTADGAEVDKGGAGEALLDQATRNLYTFMGTQASLTHADNQFSLANSLITTTVLDVTTEDQREDLINEVAGVDEDWILGDILHSEPAVVHYDTDEDGELDATYIFTGSNDGMMRCFDDHDGTEVWGFIPPDQLERLTLLLNNDHDYFIDGAPTVYQGEGQKILFFGERRGGNHYYALDVTSVQSPRWLYKLGADILGGGSLQLGQSWSRPETHTIKTGIDGDPEHTVFLMAGGYDHANQDLDTPAPSDTIGKAIFTVTVTDGTPSSLNCNAGTSPEMTHCIVDVSGFDTTADGFMNRAYAGDLGGQVFALEDDNGDGTWSVRKLFSSSVVDGVQRKIFHAPDAVREPFGEIIFFGTGDRADPKETGVENRLYVVENDWAPIDTFTTLTESDLVDVTEDLIQLGTAEQKAQVQQALETSQGWYIRLEHPGEKVTASPTVFAGVVYFTTYTPTTDDTAIPDDPCGAPTASGIARLYAVDYLTGAAVHDYSPIVEIDQETGQPAVLGKLDRSKVIGSAIPSAPVIAVLESGPKIFVGVEGGVVQETPRVKTDVNIFYWRQLFF